MKLLSGRIRDSQVLQWMTVWAELCAAGLPVVDALDTSLEFLPQGGGAQGLCKRLGQVKHLLSKGQNLTGSFASVFQPLPRPLHIALMCGESSGQLSDSLSSQVHAWQGQLRWRNELLRSLMYPVTVMAMSLFTAAIMHSQLGNMAAVPQQTTGPHTWPIGQVLMGAGIVAFIAACSIRTFNRRKLGKASTRAVALYPAPRGVKALWAHRYLAEELNLMAAQLDAGIPLMAVIDHTLGFDRSNRGPTRIAWRRFLRQVSLGLNQGQPLSQVVLAAGAPRLMVEQCKLAEQHGDLGRCFRLCASVHQARANILQQRLTALLAPATLALAALILGWAAHNTLGQLYGQLGSGTWMQ